MKQIIFYFLMLFSLSFSMANADTRTNPSKNSNGNGNGNDLSAAIALLETTMTDGCIAAIDGTCKVINASDPQKPSGYDDETGFPNPEIIIQ